MRPLCFSLACVLLLGCGAAHPSPSRAPQPSRPVAQFPEVQRVELALQGEPPDLAALLPHNDTVRVAEWIVESEPAPADPPYTADDDPFEALLDSVATERGITLSRSASLRCAARELARFYARHGGMPSDDLTSFVLAACGSSSLAASRAGSRARVHGTFQLAELARTQSAPLRESLGHALVDGHMHGLGVAREGDAVAVVVVSTPRTAALAPWGPPNELGEVHIEGQLATEGDALIAFVNQGELGVAPCRIEPTVQLPAIDVRCPMAEGDETALVNLETITVGRVLARRAATIMLRREGARPAMRSTVADETETGDLRAALLARLNDARARAGVPPLALAADESETHARAAPFAAASTITGDEAVSEVVGLGLMAGWGVRGGTIRWAHHLTQIELGTRSPAHWVETVLAQPIGRLLLLRPDARQAALGVVSLEEPAAIIATVSTYSFYESLDHDADVERLFARIERERTRRGLPPPRRMQGLDVLRAQAARVSRGQIEPAAAFQIALDQESQRRGASLSGLELDAVDLELASLPEALFARRDLTLGIAVAHTRAPGAAWGQYVVYFVIGR